MATEQSVSEFDAGEVWRVGKAIAQGTEPNKEYSVNRLFEIAHPMSMRYLALAIKRLINAGTLRQRIRVVARNGGGIGEFESIEEVPSVIENWREGFKVEVKPEQLEIIYRKIK